MPTDILKDNLLTASIDLERFAAGVDKKVEKLLIDTQNYVLNEIQLMDFDDPDSSAFRKNRLQGLYNRIDKVIRKQYEEIGREIQTDLEEIPGVSDSMVTGIMNSYYGVDVITLGLSQTQLESLVANASVDGGVLGEWMATQADRLSRAIKAQIASVVNEINIGILAGETAVELAKRIKGTVEVPGVMDKSKKDLYHFIRTYTAQVAHDSRLAMYQKYDYLLSAYKIVATLDARTTPLCRGYDGLEYTTDFKPIGHRKRYPRAGGPPFHWNCRTVLVPITKTFEELSQGGTLTQAQKREFDKMTDAERAALGGPMEQSKSYDDWFRKQSVTLQRQILGPKRYEIWKKHGLTMAQMLDQRGNTLTIEQLKRRYPTKFE